MKVQINETRIIKGIRRTLEICCEKCGSHITNFTEGGEGTVNWDLYHCEKNGCTVPVEQGVECSGAQWKSFVSYGPHFLAWHFKCNFCEESWIIYGVPGELPVTPEGNLHGICPNKCHQKNGG